MAGDDEGISLYPAPVSPALKPSPVSPAPVAAEPVGQDPAQVSPALKPVRWDASPLPSTSAADAQQAPPTSSPAPALEAAEQEEVAASAVVLATTSDAPDEANASAVVLATTSDPSASHGPPPQAVLDHSCSEAALDASDEELPAGVLVDDEIPPLVCVLLGRVGVGKSSTANALIGEGAPFSARRSAAAVTRTCASGERILDAALLEQLAAARGPDAAVMEKILVLDTPGVGDLTNTDADIYTEIRTGLADQLPPSSPVCLLLVFSLASRVGEEEIQLMTNLRDHVFGHGMFHSSIVVWTHSDLLESDGELEEYLKDIDPRLQQMLDSARGGSVVVSNKGDAGLQAELPALLAKAAAVAAASCPLAKPCAAGTDRIAGRKSARRQRQMQAGLLKQHDVPAPNGAVSSCVIA